MLLLKFQVLENVRKGYQVMVFVHARNATVATAERLRDLATQFVIELKLIQTRSILSLDINADLQGWDNR